MTTFLAVLRRRLRLDLVRYPLESIAQIVLYYVLFLVLFLGARAVGGSSVVRGNTVSSIVVGYIVFMILQQCLSAIYGGIREESTTGTLEQLAMADFGLLVILAMDFAVGAISSIVQMSVTLVPIMATTGRWLHFDAVSVAVLLVPTVAGVFGLGLAMGGLGLVFKRVAGIAGFVAMGFLALVAAPVDRVPILKLLPVSHGNALLRDALVDGQAALARPLELATLLCVSAAYLVGGAFVFRRMDRIARNRGLLGQY